MTCPPNVDPVYFEQNIESDAQPQTLRSIQVGENFSAANQLVPRAELQDLELWEKFSTLQNEMIVTKEGRRMFPNLQVRLFGLISSAMYNVSLEISNVDRQRYRYVKGKWCAVGIGEPHLNRNAYLHPRSPCSGEELMKGLVSFHKVKLTNSFGNASGSKINVYSQHKYQPRICISRFDNMDIKPAETILHFAFSQTIFMTVTAYQNKMVTKLKIDNNPFARGFRDDGGKVAHKRLWAEAAIGSQALSTPQQSTSSSSNKRFKTSSHGSQHSTFVQDAQQPNPFSNLSPVSMTPQQLAPAYHHNRLQRFNCNQFTWQGHSQQHMLSTTAQHPEAPQVTNWQGHSQQRMLSTIAQYPEAQQVTNWQAHSQQRMLSTIAQYPEAQQVTSRQPQTLSQVNRQHCGYLMPSNVENKNNGQFGYLQYPKATNIIQHDYSPAVFEPHCKVELDGHSNFGGAQGFPHDGTSAASGLTQSSFSAADMHLGKKSGAAAGRYHNGPSYAGRLCDDSNFAAGTLFNNGSGMSQLGTAAACSYANGGLNTTIQGIGQQVSGYNGQNAQTVSYASNMLETNSSLAAEQPSYQHQFHR